MGVEAQLWRVGRRSEAALRGWVVSGTSCTVAELITKVLGLAPAADAGYYSDDNITDATDDDPELLIASRCASVPK